MDFRSARICPDLPQVRRRWFLRALCAGGFLGWLAQVDAVAGASAPSPQQTKRVPPPRIPSALSVFIDHLIPADDLTPAASTLQVPQSVWLNAQADAEFQQLILWTCQWLDRYGEGYDTLHEDEREVLMQWMAKAPWEAPQRRFFHLIREQAMSLYYSDSRAWAGLPLTHPPQPMGYALK